MNKTTRDRKGWDLFFEFPRTDDEDADEWFDARAPELICQVQVKGTRNARRIGVRLSNWERHAKSPLPVFFVVVRFDHKNLPSKVYVAPVDLKRTSQVLRRLREIAAQERAKKRRTRRSLNRMTLDLRWSEEEALAKVDGECIAAAIRRHVGHVATYHQRKSEWIARAGTEDGHATHSVSVTMEGRRLEDDFEAFSDLAVGLRKSIPISRVTVREERFGIRRVLKDEAVPGGSFSIGSVPPFDTVRLSVARGKEAAAVQATAYLSPFVFPFLPLKHWKLRCVTPVGDVLVRPIDGGATFSFETGDLDVETSLPSLRAFLQVVALATREGQHPVEISVTTSDGSVVRNIGLSRPSRAGVDISLLANAVEQMATLCRAADVHDPMVVPLELIELAQRLELMATPYRVPCPIVRMEGFLESRPAELSDSGMILRTAVPVGARVIFQALLVTGEAIWRPEDNGGFVVVRGKPSILVREVVDRSSWPAWLEGTGTELLDEAMKPLEAAGIRHVFRA